MGASPTHEDGSRLVLSPAMAAPQQAVRRPYASSSRDRKARATRERILEAAGRLFAEQGYVSTTIEFVAKEADVAVQTIYFIFGNKRSMLKELVDVTVAGDHEPIPTLERPWVKEVLTEPKPGAQLRLHVHKVREIYERVSPVLEVVRQAADVDPEIAQLWQSNREQRRVVLERVLRSLVAKGGLRKGLGLKRASDVGYALLSQEMFQLMVADRGWSPLEWERWTAEVLCRQLLPEEPVG